MGKSTNVATAKQATANDLDEYKDLIFDILQFQDEFEVIPADTIAFLRSVRDFANIHGYLSQRQKDAINNVARSVNQYIAKQHNRGWDC